MMLKYSSKQGKNLRLIALLDLFQEIRQLIHIYSFLLYEIGKQLLWLPREVVGKQFLHGFLSVVLFLQNGEIAMRFPKTLMSNNPLLVQFTDQRAEGSYGWLRFRHLSPYLLYKSFL